MGVPLSQQVAHVLQGIALNTTTATEQLNRLLGNLALSISSKQWDRARKVKSRIQRIGPASALDQANLERREADYALRNGDAVTSAERAESAANRYRAAGYGSAAAACIRVQADAAASQGELRRALDLYQSAIDSHTKSGDWLGLARTIEHLAQLDHSRGYASEAAELMELSRELTMTGGGS